MASISGPLVAGANVVTWDNSAGTALWSTAENWSGDIVPDAATDVVFPAALPGTITLASGEAARTLSFGAACALNGGSLALAAGNSIQVDNGVTATLATELNHNGNLVKHGQGTLLLAPAYSNPGSTGDLVIQNGVVAISSDAALGLPGNGVQLVGSTSTLRIDASFESARTISAGSITTALAVAEGCEFSFSGQLAGAGFRKSGPGVMALAPEVDSSARGNAPTQVRDGILRVQGITSLSANGPIDVAGNHLAGYMGIAEFLRDEDTVFPHPVIGRGGTIHVDRSPGGTRENGRHTLGPVSMNDLSLRVTGDHGYGLTLGPVTISNSGGIVNEATAPVIVPSVMQSTSGNFSLYGEVDITGALTRASGSPGPFGLNLHFAKVRLGTSAAGLNGPLSLSGESLLDTNHLSLTPSSVTLTGSHDHPETPPPGPQLKLGGGILNLGGQLKFSSPQSKGLITGQLSLGSTSHDFVIGSYSQEEELTIDGPISGYGSAGITKSGPGLLRLTGAANSFPGSLKVTAGEVQLDKTSGLGTGEGGLVIDSGTNSQRTGVTLFADEQLPDVAPLSMTGFGSPLGGTDIFLDIGNHTETVGPLNLAYQGGRGSVAIRTGNGGKLVVNGDLSFSNHTFGGTVGRQVMISGNGTLDLGGAMRTARVTSNSTFAPWVNQANATIEARVVNGGIIKTGNRTLFLTHPGNEITGGIEVREGFIGPGPAGSLGTGPVVFTNAPGVVAGYDFGATTGPWATNLTIPAGREFEIRHSGDGPDAAQVTGNIALERDLPVDVVVGSHDTSYGGTLDLSGVISDGPSTFGLIKRGEGVLKLGPANTFGGATRIERGTLWITGAGSLGSGNDPLTIDGGCLMAADSFALPRDVAFTARGGSLRGDGSPGMEITGQVDWGDGITSSFGAGTTVLSGSTSGSGNFQLGYPHGFYTGWSTSIAYWDVGETHCLSLRGAAALPAGNLQIDRFAVLELGNGDFTRPLGTGPGEFQMRTSFGGGWAAHGADRTVNIGGSGETLTWGQAHPPFLYRQESTSTGTYTSIGALVLGSSTATHTVTFVNPLIFSTVDDWPEIITRDGPADIDARLAGGLALDSGGTEPVPLQLRSTGTLEITGALRGHFTVTQDGPGTTIFRGANESREMYLSEGRWIIADGSSLASVRKMTFNGELDVSSQPGGLVMHPAGELLIGGQVTGDVTAAASVTAVGDFAEISGDLFVGETSQLVAGPDAPLRIGGNLNFAAESQMRARAAAGPRGDRDFPLVEVSGAVVLQGSLAIQDFVGYPAVGGSIVLIANHGTDPVLGTFDGLPEGAMIPATGGYGFRISYSGNSDEGVIGNDVVLSVIPLATSEDGRLTANAPLAVEPGGEIAVHYSVSGTTAGEESASLHVELPGNVTFLGSTPSGQLAGSTLSIDLPSVGSEAPGNAVVRVAAPSVSLPATVRISATCSGGTLPPVETLTAVLPGDRLPTPLMQRDPVDPSLLRLSLETLADVRYLLEASSNLRYWQPMQHVDGNGGIRDTSVPFASEWWPTGFYRFRIVPPGAPPEAE